MMKTIATVLLIIALLVSCLALMGGIMGGFE